MIDFYAEAQKLFAYTQGLRRDFHMHPELGFQEVRTSGIIAKELRETGLEVSTGIGKTGVVALVEGSKPGPVIMLRFDIDALPINEQTGAEYASQNPGVMHACGHDGHAAIGLTVAKLLNNHREQLNGTVKLVFQPAEEGLGGAESMIKDGVLESPAPVRALGLHLWNEKPVGWIGVAAGPVMAGAATFDITVRGKGGHGAAPHLGIDPVVGAAQIVTAVQSIASRNVDPQKAAVISVCTIHGGDAFNVIPQEVRMSGTIRYYEPAIGELTFKRLREVAEHVASGMGCVADVTITFLTPPVINEEDAAGRIQAITKTILPDATLHTNPYVTMGSEDYAYFSEKVPGCYFFVGSNNAERGLNYGHHHPKFDVDEAALPRAAALMAASAVEMLK
jgi:amidohydrolase